MPTIHTHTNDSISCITASKRDSNKATISKIAGIHWLFPAEFLAFWCNFKPRRVKTLQTRPLYVHPKPLSSSASSTHSKFEERGEALTQKKCVQRASERIFAYVRSSDEGAKFARLRLRPEVSKAGHIHHVVRSRE